MDTTNHRQVACKMIKTRKEEETKKIWSEVRILMALNHVSFFLKRIGLRLKRLHRHSFQPNINKIYEFEVEGRCTSVVRLPFERHAPTHLPSSIGKSSSSYALVGTSLLTLPIIPILAIALSKAKPSISCISSSKDVSDMASASIFVIHSAQSDISA